MTLEVDIIEEIDDIVLEKYNTVLKVEAMLLNELQANAKIDKMIQIYEEN